VLLLAWRLQAHPDADEFAKALAGGAAISMPILALLLGLRAAARPKGLGEAHFRWQSATLKHLRRNLPLLLPVAFPLSLLLGAIEVRSRSVQPGSLATLVLLAMQLLMLIVGWRMLHPGHGMLASGIKNAAVPLRRFRWLWFLLGFGTPLTFLVMTVLGFDYTAMQLARRLFYTLAFVAAGAVIHALIVRALVLERRRLQIRAAQERLQAARAAGDGTAPPEPPPDEAIDPQSVARQTQTLLRGAITIVVVVAAYQIWVDVLPALAILDRITLWADATTPAASTTLFDLLLSLGILIAATAAARNLPGLLELLLLQRLPMQAGERHAIKTLARYGIVIVGVLIAFSTIGVGWSKVQWLVAAVSVGLGFGLQEIFANFVSGLILLFERPARVGDIVTVGSIVGRVTRIRIRATTIQDWDRKELVVPNREFVTNQFVNWTLTDAVVRWTIPVGVAYGTDTKLALGLLQQAAAASPQVLREPQPEAVFVRFGDSTLDLQLRVYVDMGTIDVGLMTGLHQAIDRLFREHGIVIAFPQRDVHLHAAGPLLERLQPGDLAASPRE
jgi:potassium efflux system protein